MSSIPSTLPSFLAHFHGQSLHSFLLPFLTISTDMLPLLPFLLLRFPYHGTYPSLPPPHIHIPRYPSYESHPSFLPYYLPRLSTLSIHPSLSPSLTELYRYTSIASSAFPFSFPHLVLQEHLTSKPSTSIRQDSQKLQRKGVRDRQW